MRQAIALITLCCTSSAAHAADGYAQACVVPR